MLPLNCISSAHPSFSCASIKRPAVSMQCCSTFQSDSTPSTHKGLIGQLCGTKASAGDNGRCWLLQSYMMHLQEQGQAFRACRFQHAHLPRRHYPPEGTGAGAFHACSAAAAMSARICSACRRRGSCASLLTPALGLVAPWAPLKCGTATFITAWGVVCVFIDSRP